MCVQIVILDIGNSWIIAAVKLCLEVDHMLTYTFCKKHFLMHYLQTWQQTFVVVAGKQNRPRNLMPR
jgi:hypothetical protein